MKKRILLFLTVLVGMALAYYFYHIYQDEYRPETLRHQYGTAVKRKLMARAKEPVKKFVPRQEYHENSGYKRSSDVDVALVKSDTKAAGVLFELQNDITELGEANAECEERYNLVLPPDKIIDPENDFFADESQLVPTINVAFNRYGNGASRDMAVGFPKKAQEVLYQYEEVSAADFSKILRAPLICRQSNLTVYMETLVEIAQEGGLSDQTKNGLLLEAFDFLSESLESNQLQDNILMSLTLLKAMGVMAGAQQSYFTELEGIYDSMTSDYSSLYDGDTEEKVIVNPGEVYNEYLFRQRAAAGDILDILRVNFAKYSSSP